MRKEEELLIKEHLRNLTDEIDPKMFIDMCNDIANQIMEGKKDITLDLDEIESITPFDLISNVVERILDESNYIGMEENKIDYYIKIGEKDPNWVKIHKMIKNK